MKNIKELFESFWVICMWPIIPIIAPFMLFMFWAAEKGLQNRYSCDQDYLNHDYHNFQQDGANPAQDGTEAESDL